MATILIVEDEILIAGEIERAVERLGHAALEPVDSSDETLAVLAGQRVDLILMDINIAGDTDGIATALLVRRQFAVPVVFLTARSDAATLNRAKLAQPYGYLLKPFTDDSLRVALEVALYNAYQAPPSRPPEPPPRAEAPPGPAPASLAPFAKYLFVRKGSSHVKVALEEVHYFEALQNYVRLRTATESFVFDATIKELEQRLPTSFFRTHRSYIVNLDRVDAYEEGCLVLGSEAVPVSRSCKDSLRTRLQLLG